MRSESQLQRDVLQPHRINHESKQVILIDMQLKTTMFNSGDGGATVMTPTNLDESLEPQPRNPSRLSRSPELQNNF